MEIQLEQIELVKDRTGVSYKEAKEALEFAEGNVVDAIIYIEENINYEYETKDSTAIGNIVERVKEIIKTGNVTKIRVFKGDDLICNIPVTVGALATVLFPWGVLAAAVATAAVKCRVELVKADGTVVDINEKAGDTVDSIKNKGGVMVDEIKDKGSDFFNSTIEKGGEIYNATKEKGGEILNAALEKGEAIYSVAVEKGKDLYEGAITKGGEIYENTKVKVTDFLNKDKGEIFDVQDLDAVEEAGDEGDNAPGDDDGTDL